jgi:hypothetical protein
MDSELKQHLTLRVIDPRIRRKLVRRLHKLNEIIDEMGHTPSRQCLDELITAIHIKLREFNDE